MTPIDLYPFDADEIAASLATCPADGLQLRTLKLDRLPANDWWGSLIGYRTDLSRGFVWPGFRVSGNRFGLPPYLARLDERWRTRIVGTVNQMLAFAFSQPGAAEAAGHVINAANGTAPGEPLRVGGDRITPGDVHPMIYVHHAKRYQFASRFAAGRTVLDLGCGVGYGTRMLGRVARSVVGIDVSEEAVAYAARVYGAPNLSFRVADARSLPLPAASMDLVVWFEMIEHIREQRAVVAEVARVLRPDGCLVVSTPNKLIYEQYPDPDHFHCGLLTLAEFRELLGTAFDCVEMCSQPRLAGHPDILNEYGVVRGANEAQEIFIAVAMGPKRAGSAS